MTSHQKHGNVSFMPGIHSISVRCEVGPDDGSLRGEAQNEFGEFRSFAGWTEFASVLMQLTVDRRMPHSNNHPEGNHREEVS